MYYKIYYLYSMHVNILITSRNCTIIALHRQNVVDIFNYIKTFFYRICK